MKFKSATAFLLFQGILVSLLLFTFSVRSAEVYFDITSAPTRKTDIALPLFSSSEAGNEAILEEIHDTFTKDLNFSGRFNVVDISRSFPNDKTEVVNPDFHAWYLAGIQSLITGYVEKTGNDFDISIRLFDVPMGQQVVGIRYRAALSNIRTIVHKFADELQFRLTGERGINFSRIAFTSKRTGHTEIYTISPDGGNLMQLTNNRSINISPTWFPDSSRLFFTSYLHTHPDLYSIDVSDLRLQPILSGGMFISPVVSPDGSSVVVSANFNGDPELLVYFLKTGKKRRITYSPGVDTNPTFAPNGRELAFTSDRSGTPQIYVMDIEGTNIRRLTYIGNYNTSPDWSPKGDWIAYHSRRNGVFDIWLIRPDGSDEHPITSEAGHNEDPTWARDGRHLAFISTRRGGKGLYVMDISGRDVRPVLINQGKCGNPAWSR